MKVKEITENQEFKAINGESSAIPGNSPPTQVEKKKKMAKSKVETLVKK